MLDIVVGLAFVALVMTPCVMALTVNLDEAHK
jgi:hypothetical protein